MNADKRRSVDKTKESLTGQLEVSDRYRFRLAKVSVTLRFLSAFIGVHPRLF
jgi:hypothetical protein